MIRLDVWAVRLLLAVLFFFGNEVLFWTELATFTPLDWVVRVAGYLALATLILDLAVRYRIQDVYDAMTLIAIYGLLVGLLISPAVGFSDFPSTLITRVMGGNVTIGFWMFGLFLTLGGRNRRRMLVYALCFAAWLGLYWGIWVHGQPFVSGLFDPLPLTILFGVAGGNLAVAAGLYALVQFVRQGITAADFELSVVGLLFVVLVLLLLFIVQAANGALSAAIIVADLLLVAICIAVLWSRNEPENALLLDQFFPLQPPSSGWLLAGTALFFAAALLGWHIPIQENLPINPVILMRVYYALAGALWLPVVAIAVAMRGIDQQMRTGQL